MDRDDVGARDDRGADQGPGNLYRGDFLLTREVAELLRTPESTVRYWRYLRVGPPSVKLGRRVLYRREAVETWLLERESRAHLAVQPTRQASPATAAASGGAATRRWPAS